MLIRRLSRAGANDLNTIYRPCKVDEMLGNSTNVNIIRKGLNNGDLHHSLLFIGDPGCGKTTAARIVALGLNCEESEVSTSDPCLKCESCKSILNHNNMDVFEINAGQSGGKDMVNEVIKDLPSSPFYSRYKVLIFDEAHQLTPQAKDLLLKIIEDGYSHVHFIFCSNQPEKFPKTFLDRCNVMYFGRISIELINDMLINVSDFEGFPRTEEVIRYLAEESKGVPRNALLWLKQVNDEGSWTLEAAKNVVGISMGEDDPNIIEISKALIRGSFKDACKIYDSVKKKNQAESVRISMFGYFTGCLKRARNFNEARKFSKVLDLLANPIYDSGRPGDNKLYHYMFKVVDTLNSK